MKKHVISVIVIALFITSCSSTKDKYNALNTYFETIVKDTTKKVIVIKEKESPNLVLRMLKINQIDSIGANGVKKDNQTLYREKDWEVMKKKYENKQHSEDGYELLGTGSWTKDDFRYKKIIFEYYGKPNDLLNKYIDLGDNFNYEMYFFSDPIYYQNRKYLAFTSTKSSMIGGGSTVLVIMEKKQKKWVQTHEGYPDWIN